MDIREQAAALVAQMSVAEKASLCSGKNVWYLKGIERLGLPEIMVTDGPHGLRKQLSSADHLGITKSIPAVCFPTASAMACSFDRELLREIGQALGEECRQENVSVLLGPGINIKRSPLCGRNFEYYSEDPYLSGELAAAFIDGVQSQNVGVSLKHFAANNQEKRRMTVDSVMDERTFREIYLAGFERAITKARPWTVMCSYNRVFGEFASQNRRLLTSILREEWGFDGLVVSDWGAVVDRVKGLAAGLDLEMPNVGDVSDSRIVQGAESGALSMQALDAAAERIVALILRAQGREPLQYDVDAHRALARRAAAQSAVLLKNDGALLPGKVSAKAAVIGAFARFPRYQGSGSSKVAPIRLDSAVEEFTRAGVDFEYADGYHLESDATDTALIEEACRIAAGKDIVYLFAGLPDRYEAESFDREKLSMPDSHTRLIEAVSKANRRLVVVLYGGSSMEIPWIERAQSILLMHLGGETTGSASVDVLLGKVNPGGKLAETWPISLSDAPSYEYFPGYPLTVEYREGIFVGYRYYDTAHRPVRYPFGHGYSYTQFEYSDLEVSSTSLQDTDLLTVTCAIKNIGQVAGSEVVQLYVAHQESIIVRPNQELKGFEKVYLKPGESRSVSFVLSRRDFAYYNTEIADWHVESGKYEIRLGSSSRDIRLLASVHVESTRPANLPDLRRIAPCYYHLENGIRVPDEEFTALLGRPIPPRERAKGSPHTINSTMSDIQDRWLGKLLLGIFRRQVEKMGKDDPDFKLMAEKMIMDAPLRFLTMMSTDESGGFSIAQVEELVEALNGRLLKALAMLRKKK